MQNPFWSSEFPCLHFTPPPLVSLCTAIYSCRLLESLLETKAFCLFPIKAFVVSSAVCPPTSFTNITTRISSVTPMGAKTVYLLTNGTLSYLSFFAFFQPFLKCNLCFCWAQTGACEMRRDISHFFFLAKFHFVTI